LPCAPATTGTSSIALRERVESNGVRRTDSTLTLELIMDALPGDIRIRRTSDWQRCPMSGARMVRRRNRSVMRCR
jgi:hypothetical protein